MKEVMDRGNGLLLCRWGQILCGAHAIGENEGHLLNNDVGPYISKVSNEAHLHEEKPIVRVVTTRLLHQQLSSGVQTNGMPCFRDLPHIHPSPSIWSLSRRPRTHEAQERMIQPHSLLQVQVLQPWPPCMQHSTAGRTDH